MRKKIALMFILLTILAVNVSLLYYHNHLKMSADTMQTSPFPRVGQSASAYATSAPPQRKSFFDTINQNYWLFYYNGTGISTAYSSDNKTWTPSTTLALNTPDFSIYYQNVSSINYLYLTIADSSGLSIISASLTNNSITFSTPTTIAATTNDIGYHKPSVAIDPTNKVILASIETDNLSQSGYNWTYNRVLSWQSTNQLNITSWKAPVEISRNDQSLDSLSLTTSPSHPVYLLLGGDSASIQSYLFDPNANSWSNADTGADNHWVSTFPGHNPSLVLTYNNDVYMNDNSTNFPRLARYNTTDQTWHNLASGISSGLVTALAKYNNYLIVGGTFPSAGNVQGTALVALWDTVSEQWLVLGSAGLPNYCVNHIVYQECSSVSSLIVHEDDLYIGGNFTPDSVLSNNVANSYLMRWNFTSHTWNIDLSLSDTNLLGNITAMADYGDNIYLVSSSRNIFSFNTVSHTLQNIGTADANIDSMTKNGNYLYLTGGFSSIGAVSKTSLLRYDLINKSWQNYGNFGTQIKGLTFDSNILYLSGNLSVNNNPCRLIKHNLLSNTTDCLEPIAYDWTHSISFLFHFGGELYGDGYYRFGDTPVNFLKFTPVPAVNLRSPSQFSTLSQNGTIHLAHIDQDGRLVYTNRDTAWHSPIILSDSSSTSTSLSLSYEPSTQQLFLFWIQDGQILYKKASAPYSYSDWSQATILSSQSTNQSLTTPEVFSPNNISLNMTQLADSQFSILSKSFTVNSSSDSTPPTGQIGLNSSTTPSTTITLNLSATDQESGISQMHFSNDNLNWSSWENYAPIKTWQLSSGGGQKTVYVQFKDQTGNVSLTYLSTITLTSVPPPTITPAPATPPSTPPVTQSLPRLAITKLHPKAKGNELRNLNDEYIAIQNTGDNAINLNRWILTNSKGQTSKLPSYTLIPGQSVTLHSGKKTTWVKIKVKRGRRTITKKVKQTVYSTPGHIYLQRSKELWPNKGGTISISMPNITRIINQSYPRFR